MREKDWTPVYLDETWYDTYVIKKMWTDNSKNVNFCTKYPMENMVNKLTEESGHEVLRLPPYH